MASGVVAAVAAEFQRRDSLPQTEACIQGLGNSELFAPRVPPFFKLVAPIPACSSKRGVSML